MQLTSTPRRALGLVAAGALGMSTAVLGVTGVAQAALPSIPFTATDSPLTVAAGYCSIDWTITGGSGGANADGDSGALGGELVYTTTVEEDDEFTFFEGLAGGDSDGVTGGSGGTNGDGYSMSGRDGDVLGGGGGAASTVLRDGSEYLWAFGGDGAGSDGDFGRGGTGGENGWVGGSVPSEVAIATAPGPGNGRISGTVQPCAPAPAPAPEKPGTPTVNWIEAGEKSATMQIWQSHVPQGSSIRVYEYSLDGGAWKRLVASDEYQVEPTITGLVNGKTYSVRVRVTVDGVSSEPTAPQTVTPYQPIGAPGNVAVTFGSASTTITWTAPAPVAGVPAVDGYDVGFWAGGFGDTLCTTAAKVLTCTATDTKWYPGHTYLFSVTPLDAAGNRGEAGRVEAVAPFPATAPAPDGPLAGSGFSSGSVTAGQTITVSGTGYAPFSTVTVLVYSSPTVLGTAEADENGAFTFTGKLPEGLAAGSHTLVAAGVDADGNPYYLTQAITVAGGTGVGGLPNTGASIAVPALAGLGALALGGGLVVAARRRSAV